MSTSQSAISAHPEIDKKRPLVMTLIGKDRPGLVQSLSELIEGHGGNWQASRMVQLCGEFAGLLSIEIPSSRIESLETALGGLANMRVTVQRGREGSPETGSFQRLEVVGQDRPGIVRQVTEVIAALGLNIEELETEVVSAPMSAERHFKAEARLWGPESCHFEPLADRLEDLGAELMVDLKDD